MKSTHAKNLIFHAGIGKTGTSALQHALFSLKSELKSNSIYFPTDHLRPKLVEEATNGKINSGNLVGPIGAKSSDSESVKGIKYIIDGSPRDCETIVFSNEGFFRRIHKSHLLQAMLKELDQEYNLSLIFCVRDIIDHTVSGYIQRVKRHGEINTFEQFLKNRKYINKGFFQLKPTLQALENMKIKFKVYNYTAHKKNITQFLLKQIGANDDLISSYDQAKIVNRSLSYAEIIFQIAVNRYALKSKCDNFKSGHFCDIVVDTIANDKKACIYPSLDSYTKIIKANEQFISFFNQYLTEPEVLTASNHDFQEFQSTHSDSMLGDIASLEKMLEIFSHYDFSKNIQKIA